MTHRQTLTVFLSAVLTLGLVPLAHAQVIEQIVVKVNGEIITKSDLEDRQLAALRQLGREVGDTLTPGDAEVQRMLAEVTPQLLVNTIDEMILVQRGRELGYKMDDAQFQSVLDNIKKDNKIESDEQFQAALRQENMTLADLRKNLERQMIVSRVQQNEVASRVGVNDVELRRFYEDHAAEFTTARSITLREILVAVPGDPGTLNVGLDEEAHAKIDAIRARVLAGESFEKLAADLSDAPSRANAGLFGPISVGDLNPDIQKVIAPMKVGDVTAVLRTTRGYQLLKLESATTPETKPFDQAREDISNRVFETKRRTEFEKYMKKLRAEAIVDWKNADAHKAYDLGLTKPATAE